MRGQRLVVVVVVGLVVVVVVVRGFPSSTFNIHMTTNYARFSLLNNRL